MSRIKNRFVYLFFAAVMTSGVTASSAFAQITGSLRGTVSDSTGAALQKATVTLTSVETRQSRTEVASASGEFSFELLTIGSYTVKAEAAGFAASVARAEVRTGEVASVDFKLELGQISQSVDVSSAVSRLDTENAQLQLSLTGQSIQEIPVARDPDFFERPVRARKHSSSSGKP